MTDPTTQQLVTSNLAWSIGGLIVGALLAAVVLRVSGTTVADRLRSLSGLIIIILLVGSQITYYRTTAASRSQVDCYRPYFADVSKALASRTPDTDATADAQIQLLMSAPEDYPAARDAYIAKLIAQKANRRAQPIPQPPDCDNP